MAPIPPTSGLSAQCAPVKYSDSKPPRMMVCFKPAMVLIHASPHSREAKNQLCPRRPRSYSYIGNVAVLDVFDKPIDDCDVVMKWLFYKIVGSLALLCALPIMAIVAIAIKLDTRGPVLFKQMRSS
jgi:hypothetical protein